jgi:G3E family GTPase
MTTSLILVGGFLGAGKTTLLLRAARLLAERGRRVGLVTNDQGEDLVDTALAAWQEIPVTEVAGGCFCCRFPDLIKALRRLQKSVSPDIILAEPVGSCTDLAATVLRPLAGYYPEQFRLAPLTVLVEPGRRSKGFPSAVDYLYHKQLAEAEIIILNKLDTLDAGQQQERLAELKSAYPTAHLMGLSARTGQGVAEWLETALARPSSVAQALELDYARYADAEACLGWLNAKGAIHSLTPFSATAWVEALLHMLEDSFASHNAPIAHIKVQMSTPTAAVKASLTQAGAPISWDVWAETSTTGVAQFIVNARVNADPRTLGQVVRRAVEALTPHPDYRCDYTHFECFSPLPPQPTHRLGPTAALRL